MLLTVRIVLVLCAVLIHAPRCRAGCSEVDSMTEAVAGQSFQLGCISCKRREEVVAETSVDWHFTPIGTNDSLHIFHKNSLHTTLPPSFTKTLRTGWSGRGRREDNGKDVSVKSSPSPHHSPSVDVLNPSLTPGTHTHVHLRRASRSTPYAVCGYTTGHHPEDGGVHSGA
ncbi:hypothetical protein NFI96_001542 [Prochilodus magdalenae]|nr:hypothetical protein NFI96_001542 [Prochilodus magdalenae]